jgi:hypothetical protein
MLLQSFAGYSGSARWILHFGAARGRHYANSKRDDDADCDPYRGHIDQVRGDRETDDDDDETDDVGSE